MGERPPPDERVDRPEVEAPRGAREPTGTNGPTLNNTPTQHVGVHTKNTNQPCRNHYTNHDQPTPPPTPWESVEHTRLVVVIAPGKRPASIPNLEAKPGSANGTATDRLWESRTPPQHTYRSGQRPFGSGRFFFILRYVEEVGSQDTTCCCEALVVACGPAGFLGTGSACPAARPSDFSGTLQTWLTNLACNSPATISSSEFTA